jgi:hypothetical protein
VTDELEELEELERTPRRGVIGQGTAVTFTVLVALVGLAFWSGRLSSRMDTVEERVPVVADAAKAYTDDQYKAISTQLTDLAQRLDRIERQLDRGTVP